MKAEIATPERVRVNGKIYVARTLAATTARMSYGYLARLCSEGKGPNGYILLFDRKQFFALSEVKRWFKSKEWRTWEPGQNTNKRKNGNLTRIVEVCLSHETYDKYRERYPNGQIGPFLRNLLIKNLEQQS